MRQPHLDTAPKSTPSAALTLAVVPTPLVVVGRPPWWWLCRHCADGACSSSQDEGDLEDEYDGGSVPDGPIRVLPRHPKIRDPFEPRSAWSGRLCQLSTHSLAGRLVWQLCTLYSLASSKHWRHWQQLLWLAAWLPVKAAKWHASMVSATAFRSVEVCPAGGAGSATTGTAGAAAGGGAAGRSPQGGRSSACTRSGGAGCRRAPTTAPSRSRTWSTGPRSRRRGGAPSRCESWAAAGCVVTPCRQHAEASS